MNIVLLLAYYENNILKNCVKHLTDVLTELDINVNVLNLTNLPYFTGEESLFMQAVKGQIEESKGVIVVSSVHTVGMHGAIQSFLDHMSQYPQVAQGKPLFVLTRSEWVGEREAAHMILKGWEVLGGMEGGMLCLNTYSELEESKMALERGIETFYRVIKQDRPNLVSSERYIYSKIKDIETKTQKEKHMDLENNRSSQMKSLVDIIKQDELTQQKEKKIQREKDLQEEKDLQKEKKVQGGFIDFSTKDQNIKDIAELLKEPIQAEQLEKFMDYNSNIYKKPSAPLGGANTSQKKLQNIPHYFIAQHDKILNIVVQYIVLDSEDKGFITIQNGDCFYKEGVTEMPQVEISLTEEILTEVLTKQVTYQKAFMLGKLKVRGNFVILPKLDQIFKGM